MATHKRVRQRATHEVARSSIVDIQTRLRDTVPAPVASEPGLPDVVAAETAPVDLEAMVRVAEAELGELLAGSEPVEELESKPADTSSHEARLAAIDARLAELESGIEEYFTRLEPAARRRIVNSDPVTDSSVADLQRVIDQRLVKRKSRIRSR
ncbi:MAG TPA: hypothetical protein VLX89_08510 [Actinomycetota bacterium]|nr:hypothetical protein [Actinomycetota bacterium]